MAKHVIAITSMPIHDICKILYPYSMLGSFAVDKNKTFTLYSKTNYNGDGLQFSSMPTTE